jgi:hypothetical protein
MPYTASGVEMKAHMKRLLFCVAVLLCGVTAAAAKAPSTYHLQVNDRAVVIPAGISCFVKEAGEVTCGGPTSQVLVRITKYDIYVLRTNTTGVTRGLYHVRR